VGTFTDFKAFAPVRKLRKPTFGPSLCQNCVKIPLAGPLLCQNSCHFTGSAIDFVQRFPLHLQLHLRILLEHLRVALPKHLDDPLVCHASGTEPCCVCRAQVIEPEIWNSGSFQGFSPGSSQGPQVSFWVSVAGKEELSVPRDCDLILERFQCELRQRDSATPFGVLESGIQRIALTKSI